MFAFLPFNVGFPEMVLIAVIGILLFGKNLPDVARQLGKSLIEFKKGIQGMTETITKESKEIVAAVKDEPTKKS